PPPPPAASKARRIVLVSCDPAALARDVAAMVEAGRSVESMRGADLFPNTHHFEVVTALR
ncbi:class I SAM-dependent RNA methyltransferase, partial [Actinotignum sanguinis]|nr:class I SAM-dependent RNA methyltransferase [Actinotignum sanguinis]